MKIQYCGGGCPSETFYDNTYPYFTKKCQQCKVSKSKVKEFVCLKKGTSSYLLETYNNALECECRTVAWAPDSEAPRDDCPDGVFLMKLVHFI